MDYALENLGPERFQHVCHALLAKAYPRTQCFPIAQPDGGRDAISFCNADDSDEFLVYQVKYVRRPHAEREPHKWLTKILAKEIVKVRALIPKGASHYFLLTNVPGTAHLDSGSIDSLQKIFASALDLPAQCWWRDDINRRLDDAWSIKWAYPDILSGSDILRVIVENGLTEDAERRTSAIRTFLSDQFERDREVRFKQVELQNKLLDLFIDVPITLHEPTPRHRHRRALHVINTIAQNHDVRRIPSREVSIGAATLLLNPLAQSSIPHIVLEGAPGQGKSTIVQYICQLHRSKILNEDATDPRVPDVHRNTHVRLPFKVDCRDLALWLSKRNPFSADEADPVPLDWQKSVESFLSAQITHGSGGGGFHVADLHAVLRLSAVLLVFDGLDEVADIELRRQVVEEIARTANRLSAIAVSLETIVTSRPAAFEDSPGLPEETFLYLQLASITRPLIEEYADKWLRARRLEGREASEVRRILKHKLDQPHLRDLARNPMQLAILLSLIQTRGGSLPDKRTALYDSYVELFFSREAQKSPVVRDYRDLLINIHGYLAWILHAEAQTKRHRGSVNAVRLHELVQKYLVDKGHDESLAERLFTGMVERVVALVSRVEGIYEFEVQPLREYFAARHLYNTAPYSPAGRERRGTKPERFDALARDFFWQNVTRFYAGCYSIGELPSLVDRLQELATCSGYRHTSHPHSLAATLLADWVFAQDPLCVRQVTALILEAIGLRQITSGGFRHRREEPLVLPKQNGNEELVERCFTLLRGGAPADYSDMLLELIRANASPKELKERWMDCTTSYVGNERTRWIKNGLQLGTLSVLTHSELSSLLSDDSHTPERLYYAFRSGHMSFITASEVRFQSVVEYILDAKADAGFRRDRTILSAFAQALLPYGYTCSFENRHPIPLFAVRSRSFRFFDEETELLVDNETSKIAISQRCKEFVSTSHAQSKRAAAEWASALEPWDALVECGRRHFGDRWAIYVLANCAAGIKSKEATCDETDRLSESGVSLCKRARYARLRAGTPTWWETQLSAPLDDLDRRFALLVLFTWAGPSVFEKLATLIDENVRSLDADSWHAVNDALQRGAYALGQERRPIKFMELTLPDTLSERTVVGFATRTDVGGWNGLYSRYLQGYEGDDSSVLELCQRVALDRAQQAPGNWNEWLPIIKRSYAKGASSDRFFGYRFARAIQNQPLPLKVAEHIVENCANYPIELVAFAEQVCRQRVAKEVTPVGKVAEEQGWF